MEESKLVRCTRGCAFDVAVDLRPDSPGFRAWTAAELSPETLRALYIPAGCAHGFLTLEDDSEVFYQMGAAYDASAARGVRWNDPAFGITWPSAPTLISEGDADALGKSVAHGSQLFDCDDRGKGHHAVYVHDAERGHEG